jgi:hypothetical protein
MKPLEHKDNNEPKPLYERQLDEILRGVERTQRRRQFWTGLQAGLRRLRGGQAVGFPYSRLIGLALALAVAGMVLRGLLPGFGGLGSLLILGGVILFLSPIVLSLGRPRGGSGVGGDEKLWRGRPVIYHDDPWQATRARLTDWVRRLRGGPPPPPPPSRGRWN